MGKVAQVNFNLMKFQLKRFDCSGEVHEVYRVPSTLKRVDRSIGDDELIGAAIIALSIESQGLEDELGISFKGCETDEDKALRLLDSYAVNPVPLDDDGNPLDLDELLSEPRDPTSPSPHTSAS